MSAGRFTTVQTGVKPGNGDEVLPGVVLPGMANTHSHAFHRALRGRTDPSGGKTFWGWREQMFALASRLNPDTYYALARAVFAEMAVSGITTVGEFHYVHHRPDAEPAAKPPSRSYTDPNAMGTVLLDAARAAGIRITLLDTCYLTGGLGPDGPLPLACAQRRFSDGSAQHWAQRMHLLEDRSDARIGAAIHSVRAVAAGDIAAMMHEVGTRPLHVHLSEQIQENVACERAYGMSPTRLLDELGVLSPATTVVHATHVDSADIGLLGAAGVAVSMCPTTERDLADGIGPARDLADAGTTLTVGSDSNVVVDLLEEARALEMNERLTTNLRGRFTPAQLVAMLTEHGHRALGWPDAGRIEPGARADLVAVRADSLRTAGAEPEQLLLTASAVDIDTVIVDGRTVVQAGRHRTVEVEAELADALGAVTSGSSANLGGRRNAGPSAAG